MKLSGLLPLHNPNNFIWNLCRGINAFPFHLHNIEALRRYRNGWRKKKNKNWNASSNFGHVNTKLEKKLPFSKSYGLKTNAYFHLSGYFLKPDCFVYFSLVKLDQVVYIGSLDLEIKLSNLNHLNKWILTEVAVVNVAM